MKSFLHRMSSIVRKNSIKSTDGDENEEENNEQERYFREMQERRRSAPDIHRRAIPIAEIPMELDENGTSIEQMNSQRVATQINPTLLTRNKYSSMRKSFLFHFFKINRNIICELKFNIIKQENFLICEIFAIVWMHG
jgi:hypothetical protein